MLPCSLNGNEVFSSETMFAIARQPGLGHANEMATVLAHIVAASLLHHVAKFAVVNAVRTSWLRHIILPGSSGILIQSV